jgi:hypothetical protein
MAADITAGLMKLNVIADELGVHRTTLVKWLGFPGAPEYIRWKKAIWTNREDMLAFTRKVVSGDATLKN